MAQEASTNAVRVSVVFSPNNSDSENANKNIGTLSNSRTATVENANDVNPNKKAQEKLNELREIKKKYEALITQNPQLLQMDELQRKNESLNGRVNELTRQLEDTEQSLESTKQSALETQKLIQQLQAQGIIGKVAPGVKDIADPLKKFSGQIVKLKNDIIITTEDFKTLKASEPITSDFSKFQPLVEKTTNAYQGYVATFNSFKNKIIEDKLLEGIISLNKRISQEPNPAELTGKRETEMRKFNKIMSDLKDCSNLLKELLILIKPNDERLKPTGYTSIFKSYTSSRIFDVPGEENFVVTTKTTEVPAGWKYLESEAFKEANNNNA